MLYSHTVGPSTYSHTAYAVATLVPLCYSCSGALGGFALTHPCREFHSHPCNVCTLAPSCEEFAKMISLGSLPSLNAESAPTAYEHDEHEQHARMIV